MNWNFIAPFKERNERKKIEERERKELRKTLANLITFPGTKLEYEEFVGYKVRIVDTGTRNYGIRLNSIFSLDLDLQRRLVSRNVEALINCQRLDYGEWYGLPVAKDETVSPIPTKNNN